VKQTSWASKLPFLAIVTILVLMLGLMPVPEVHAASICVSQNVADGCYTSIQAAVDAAADGDTINVQPGTFLEQVTLNKSVHLVGAGAGVSIIKAPATLPPSSSQTSVIVNIAGSGVNAELAGFTVTGPGPVACGSISAGIVVRDGANAAIHNNTIQDVRDSTFSGCQNGVALLVGRQAWSTFGTATIADNTITGYQKGGIVIDNTGSNATITNNVVTGAGNTAVTAQNGIQISRGATATLSGNTVSGNSFHLAGNGWDWGAGGILLYQSGAVTLSGGNTISGNDQNLYIESGSGAVTLGAETFGGSAAPAGTGFDIYNNGAAAIDATQVTFTGAADGFAVEDRVFHKLNDAALGLVTWSANNVFVTPASGSIQRAIDAASAGGTVNVAAGIYKENVIVNKTLTLAGAGSANTILQPAISNTYCAESASLCSGASNVILVQANGVVIHDLAIDGDNPDLATGFNSGGANIDARNGIITDHTAGVFNGLEVHHVAVRNIFLRGIYASSGGSFNLHDNSVTNVQADPASIAIFAYGGGPGIIANNTVSYANDAISANHSKGVQFLNNTITHSQSGIHTDNAGDGGGTADLIQDNTVSDCTPGGYGVWTFVPYIAPTVNRNTISNCSIGLSAWGQGAAVTTAFTNNTVNGPAKEKDSVGAYITTDLINWGYSDIAVAFSDNIISGNETGVYLTADQQSWNPEPYVLKAIQANFARNQITGNTTAYENKTTTPMNFESNWWGLATGPVTAEIKGPIDYDPWCGNAACTFTIGSTGGTVVVPPGTSAADIQALINGAPYGTTIVLPAEPISGSGGFTIPHPGITIKLADGTVIQNSSPCFIVAANDTTITSTSPLGAKCVPTNGASGIVVNDGIQNLVINGIDFDGSSQATADGIHFAGAVANLQIIDNSFHDLDGSGISFAAVPTGTPVDIQGNLFKNNAGFGVSAPGDVNVSYNAWGSSGGPNGAGGDGVSPAITSFTPWTHVSLSMTSSGSPIANNVTVGGTITYTIAMDAQQVMGVDFALLYPASKLSVVSTTIGSVWGGTGTLDTTQPGKIAFHGTAPLNQPAVPITGNAVTVYSVTFSGLAAESAPNNLDLVESGATFAMAPTSGPSTSIYAAAITDGSVRVNATYAVTGVVSLQGRVDRSGVVVTLLLGAGQGYGPYPATSTNNLGSNLSFGVVVNDVYQITTNMARYLDVTDALNKTKVIDDSHTTLAALELKGGDANDDNVIGIVDAGIIGGQYGLSGAAITVPGADVNYSGKVDIFDLALMGGNYGLNSATAYGSWVP